MDFCSIKRVFRVHKSLAVTIRPDIADKCDIRVGDYVVMEPGAKDGEVKLYKWTKDHWRGRPDYGARDLKAESGRASPEG